MANQKPLLIMVAAIIMLTIPGLFVNTFGNEGLNPGLILTCPGADASNPNVVDVTCQNSITSGCVSTPSACTLNGASISFLNRNSPFTDILSGNIGNLFVDLTNQGVATTHAPFDLMGGGQYVPGSCVFSEQGGKGLTTVTIHTCNQTVGNKNATQRQAANFTNWNTVLSGLTNKASMKQMPNATAAFSSLNCQWQTQINYTGAASTSGWTYFACDYSHTGVSTNADAVSQAVWSVWVAMPYGATGCSTQGNACHIAFPTGYTCASGANACIHVNVYIQAESWDSNECLTSLTATQTFTNFYSQQCQSFFDTIRTQGTAPLGGASSLNFGFITPIFTFFLGIILLVLGLGIQFGFGASLFASGGSFTLGSNSQGTRLAQALGIGLLIWSPLYSEFATWFSSGNLPYGLDGSLTSIASGGGIIALFLTSLFFTATVWLSMSFGDGT